jgi:hypothetical protein
MQNVNKPIAWVGAFKLHSGMWDKAWNGSTNKASKQFENWIEENDLLILNDPKLPTYLGRSGNKDTYRIHK